VPSPSLLLSSSRPWWCSIRVLLSDSPSPVPWYRREKVFSTWANGVRTRAISDSPIPMPVSEIASFSPSPGSTRTEMLPPDSEN
jgi:hypothetical protein